MKKASNCCFKLLSLSLLITFLGCNDPKRVIDDNVEIANLNWSYLNKIKFDVKIDNEKIAYNILLNLRISSMYKYANMYLLVNVSGPQLNKGPARAELKLADPTGEWRGKGSGNFYSYQQLYAPKFKFPAKGIYHIEIEQNMRDNPLHEVSDVGVRVEKAE